MKRVACFLCALLMLALTACTPAAEAPIETPEPSPSETTTPTPDPSPDPSQEASPQPSPEPEYFNPLTGEPMEEDTANRKPVAIMLNNIKAAMPQQGNSQADIIYEVLAEGGITRMMGVYHDISDVGRIGSIRSARLYYLELALGHDAVYIHAGGSAEFSQYQKAWGVRTIDGVEGPYSNSSIFFRDRNRYGNQYYAYEHSLLTNGSSTFDKLTELGFLTDHKAGYTYEMNFAADGTPADGQPAKEIVVPFSKKTTTLKYDEDRGVYLMEQHGSVYIDGNDNSQIAVTNALILRTSCTVADDAGHMAVNLSSGQGWYACGGKIIPITWKKGDRNSQLRYYTTDGEPLTLGQGKSYVAIIPLTKDISVK